MISDTTPTIMIADDMFFMRNLLRSILETNGFRVVCEACDGMEAVEKFKEHAPSVVLMDVAMPLKGGLQACREIMDLGADTKVIICSSVNVQELEQVARSAKAKGFLPKPFSEEQVIETIVRVIAGASL